MFNRLREIGQQEKFRTFDLKILKLEENTKGPGTTTLHTQVFNGILELMFLNQMGHHLLATFMQIQMDLTFVIFNLKMSILMVIV
jgi:hypothetical protein